MRENTKSNRPKNFLAAMSRYDVEYINYFTGLKPILIEPTGALYGALDLVQKYEKLNKKTEILLGLGSTHSIHKDELNRLMNFAKTRNYTLSNPHKMYGRYKLEQIISHPAIIYIPQSVHCQTFVEIYALNIPIFVPSIDFLITLHTLHERTTSGEKH